ncbi:MAG: hypothetical protein WD025_01685 [Bacteriovoracaceae bacterium]
MNKSIFLLILLIFTSAGAQVDTMQDRPAIHWSELEDEDFKVIFPSHMERKGQYILNLLKYYKDPVRSSYASDEYLKTKKLPLVIRSELAQPNGFVTLMPRRSEWFSHSAITPVVSSLEWYQSLAIHEYRHVVQFDFFDRPHTNVGRALFGEMGLAVLMAISAPAWYFEGDAVWAETTLSSAGRGRAPRFSARMKSLIINNQLPSYDELIGGMYNTVLPNHYVFGYFLTTRVYNLYGEEAWKNIISEAAKRPYNLYTFYNAFKSVTGKDFIQFYEETLQELKAKWKEGPQEYNQLYTVYEYPIYRDGALYYLKFDLDNYWQLCRKKNGLDKKIADLSLVPSLSKVDVRRGNFVYAQNLPDKRYGYRSYSDLFLLDVASGKQKRLTEKRRLYNPQIHPEIDQIMAVEFKENNLFGLSFFDFSGEKTREILLEDHTIAEALWLDNENLLAIALNQQGMKYIAKLNLKSKELEILKNAGRNNIFGLQVGGGKAYFEADDQGVVNIFSLDLDSLKLRRHGDEKIAAYRPFPAGDKIYYVGEIGNGQKIKSVNIEGSPVESDFLSDFSKYLGEGPSSNYANTAPKTVKNFDKLFEKSAVKKDFFELERGLTPHSWSFIGGRGYQLQAITQNYLNTFSLVAAVGEDAQESRPFANLTLNFKKYYPIFSLNLDYTERSVETEEEKEDQWSEARAGLGMSLPYIYQKNLYSGLNLLSLFGESLQVSYRENAGIHDVSDEQLLIKRAVLNSSFLKRRRYRELYPNWGYKLQAHYIDAEAAQDEDFSSYLGYGKLSLFAPGFQVNHGTNLALSGEYRTNDPSAYRVNSPANQINAYAFSRGYGYEQVDSWQKASLNYILPLSYPNASWGRWFYFNRIYSNLFFDHTKIFDEREESLNSYGAEFYFESLSFRKIPLTYGLRWMNKLSREDENVAEVFINLDVAF